MKKILHNKAFIISLSILILLAGFVFFWVMVKTRSTVTKQPSAAVQAYPVEVVTVQASRYDIVLDAWGVVKPAIDVTITPQVSGEVVQSSLDLVPGGLFKKNQFMLQIEPTNYELMVQQKKSELAIAQAALQIEYGNQRIAQQEFKIIDQPLTDEEMILVLRKPQLETANANIQIAQVALDNAELDLKRTTILSPFDALVLEESIDIGSQVAAQSSIARLVGTQYYWVEVVLPLNQLKWIRLDNESQANNVNLFYPSVWSIGKHREGKVVRILGNLTEMGRMVKLLIQVDDPLALTKVHEGQPKLLIGSYLQAKIEGESLKNVIKLNRQWVHNGNQVWVLKDNQLYTKSINVIYENQNVVITPSLSSGDRVIITDIGIVSDGMSVKVLNSNNTQKVLN